MRGKFQFRACPRFKSRQGIWCRIAQSCIAHPKSEDVGVQANNKCLAGPCGALLASAGVVVVLLSSRGSKVLPYVDAQHVKLVPESEGGSMC